MASFLANDLFIVLALLITVEGIKNIALAINLIKKIRKNKLSEFSIKNRSGNGKNNSFSKVLQIDGKNVEVEFIESKNTEHLDVRENVLNTIINSIGALINTGIIVSKVLILYTSETIVRTQYIDEIGSVIMENIISVEAHNNVYTDTISQIDKLAESGFYDPRLHEKLREKLMERAKNGMH